MANNDYRAEAPIERIDADAVCAQCGTVNPEGSLLCKSCGNNLRDQRMQRIAGGEGAVVAGLDETRPVWVKGLLALLGILIIVWAALNADKIAGMTVGVQTGRGSDASGDPESFWVGPTSAVYDAMADEVRTDPTPKTTIDATMAAPVASEAFEGRYVLVVNTALFGPTAIGEAVVRMDSGSLLFAGVVADEEYEFRGLAEFEGEGRISVRNTAAVRKGNSYYLCQGFAAESAPGVFACYAMSDIDASNSFSALAYWIPDEAPPASVP